MIPIRAIPDFAERYDLMIVGAGPAGLSAATTAAGLGLSVLVADENLTPGGQIYRSITTTPVTARDVLGEHYWHGLDLARAFEASSCSYAPRTTVWSAAPIDAEPAQAGFEIGLSLGGAARMIEAGHVILATGALERPFPVPGWTLPGVMTAGAAQIALKSSGLVPEGRTVLAGCGPLLYLLATQLQAAGANLVAVLDTAPRGNWMAALPALPDFLASPYLASGLRLLATARRKLRWLGGVTELRIDGQDKAEAVIFTRNGRSESLDCDQVLLHQGVIPNINMANALGCAQDWDEAQHAFVPRVDDWFGSSVPGIAIAGDGAGIGGAESAAQRGVLAALAAAHQLGRIDAGERDRRASPVRAALGKLVRGRRFLDALYKPAPQFLAPRDPETIACRCEEVRAGQVRETTATLGVQGPNQLKSFLRCGMGPCQGRLCGPTIVELMAEARGVSPAEIGYYRLRPPVKPVTLGELAGLPRNDAAVKAVVR
ncbi:FAD-dependent oxidoreductase [Bosea sp. (in: a-proteobacteria)]|jgi:thioredoxin reductase|uniref:FAD-dependent oxidoreductase n=1 Tax=Bosea sp. (in: a-proteobacteria) TaxID=1871050 RepID=UPI003F72E490